MPMNHAVMGSRTLLYGTNYRVQPHARRPAPPRPAAALRCPRPLAVRCPPPPLHVAVVVVVVAAAAAAVPSVSSTRIGVLGPRVGVLATHSNRGAGGGRGGGRGRRASTWGRWPSGPSPASSPPSSPPPAPEPGLRRSAAPRSSGRPAAVPRCPGPPAVPRPAALVTDMIQSPTAAIPSRHVPAIRVQLPSRPRPSPQCRR